MLVLSRSPSPLHPIMLSRVVYNKGSSSVASMQTPHFHWRRKKSWVDSGVQQNCLYQEFSNIIAWATVVIPSLAKERTQVRWSSWHSFILTHHSWVALDLRLTSSLWESAEWKFENQVARKGWRDHKGISSEAMVSLTFLSTDAVLWPPLLHSMLAVDLDRQLHFTLLAKLFSAAAFRLHIPTRECLMSKQICFSTRKTTK